MKRTLSVLLILCLLLAGAASASAEQPRKSPVYELYSADGYYTDSIGNAWNYSYHVPQIFADTPDAEEINREIAEIYGERVESFFRTMEGGHSLWCDDIGWHAFWEGERLFLLVKAAQNADVDEYEAYGYDFETGSRVTNDMILQQKGISEEDYLANLKEAAGSMVTDQYASFPEEKREEYGYSDLLEKTQAWQTMDAPMFIDGNGEIATVTEIGTVAGAGKYERVVHPFVHRIRISGEPDLVEACPETARVGETVTLRLLDVTDGDIVVSGADGTRENWYEYRFVMPPHDVEITVEFIGNGLA